MAISHKITFFLVAALLFYISMLGTSSSNEQHDSRYHLRHRGRGGTLDGHHHSIALHVSSDPSGSPSVSPSSFPSATPSDSPSTTPSSSPTETPKPQLEYVPTASGGYKFKILQLTDLHLGESEEKDYETHDMIGRMITYEEPDFIVLTGDQITAGYIDQDAISYYDNLARTLETYGTPWALLFGNKDVDTYQGLDLLNRTNFDDLPPKTSRKMLAQADMRHQLSLTQVGPEELFGVSNYFLDIHHQEETATRVFMFDTGGGSEMEARTEQNQVDWFTANNDPDIPAVVFHHYPLDSGTGSLFDFDDTRCNGFDGFDGSRPKGVEYDAGLFNAMVSSGNVKVLGVGHNHRLGYCCELADDNFSFCYGRKTGYGGGSRRWIAKGARVYDLRLDSAGNFAGWESHVRMKYGELVDQFDPDNYPRAPEPP